MKNRRTSGSKVPNPAPGLGGVRQKAARKYIFIGCGSFLGAVARYAIRSIPLQGYGGSIPLNTLFINISGAFLLAFLLTLALEGPAFDEDIRLGITTGFVGAYTTFSTLCKETVALMYAGKYVSSAWYVAVSVAFGLGAVYLGVAAAHAAGAKLFGARQLPDAPEGEAE